MGHQHPDIGEQQRVYDEYFCNIYSLKADLTVGEKCVIISKDWFDKWLEYIRRSHGDGESSLRSEGKGDPPGPLDFASISRNGKLKDGLTEGADVICIHEELYTKFDRWYGTKSREDIPYRFVYAADDKEACYDLYPPILHLVPRGNHKNFTLKCNSRATIGFVKSSIRSENGLDSDVEIDLIDATHKDKLTNEDRATLKECSLEGEKEIIYSVTSRSLSNGDGFYGMQSSRFGSSQYPVGVCGLNNLGNTCFMNSAIQCISNVSPLRKYVLADNFVEHINYNNKLGSGGLIASEFAKLMRTMWSEGSRGSSCVPRDLKMVISRMAPQFAGYLQHDAQELMNFLLDFLNEDLNKIKEKPYIEVKDADGRADEVVAEEAWSNFRKRNDSIIVDLFYGLLKSTVTCPECDRISVTFDPFNSLSLPLSVSHMNVEMWPDEIYRLPVVPSFSAKDIISSLERRKTHRDDHEFVVTFLDAGRLKVVPSSSNESLRHRNVIVFDLPKGSHMQIFLYVNGKAEPWPFLIGLGEYCKRIDKDRLVSIVKKQLSISKRYTKIVEQFDDMEELGFEPSVDVFDVDDETPISIRLPESLEIPMEKEEREFDILLGDCIDLFLVSEKLGDDNLWYCKECRKLQQGFKKFDIWSLPKVLVIHLKRYKTAYRMHKNEVFIDYPERNLKVTGAEGTCVYDLVAVSNHVGYLGGGHYTAYAKNGDKWYNFNDSHVSRLTGPVTTREAYILVYTVKETVPTGPKVINGH